MKPTKHRHCRKPEAIASDILANCARYNAREIPETEWRMTQERLWREADFGEQHYCGVRSQSSRRVEAIMRFVR